MTRKRIIKQRIPAFELFSQINCFYFKIIIKIMHRNFMKTLETKLFKEKNYIISPLFINLFPVR